MLKECVTDLLAKQVTEGTEVVRNLREEVGRRCRGRLKPKRQRKLGAWVEGSWFLEAKAGQPLGARSQAAESCLEGRDRALWAGGAWLSSLLDASKPFPSRE